MVENLPRKRSVIVNGHRTSITLEDEFWDALKEIAVHEGKTINTLISLLDKQQPQNLSSLVKVFILNFFRLKG